MVTELLPPFSHIEVVLVRPLRPGNIGSTARAMKNMGFSKLVLVDSCNHLVSEAYQMAYGAHDILEGASQFSTLPEAVSKVARVIAFTGHSYQQYEAPRPLPKVVPEIITEAQNHPIALVFGSEATGLNRDEIPICHLFSMIPTAGIHASLNLAQAVVVVLYEILWEYQKRVSTVNVDKDQRKNLLGLSSLSENPQSTHFQVPPQALVGQTERLYMEFEVFLTKIGFIRGRQGKSTLLKIRRLFSRTGLTSQEVRLLRGIVHEVSWVLSRSQKTQNR